MIKMIVTDLDGTLLNKEKKVTEETKKYLSVLKEKGYIIVIATGRIYQEALCATDGASFANYIITDTGSCIYDDKNNVVKKNTIEKNIIKKILAFYNKQIRKLKIYNDVKAFEYEKGQEEEILEQCKEITHSSIEIFNSENFEKLYEVLKREFHELEIIKMQDSFSDKNWLELMPKGCTKFKAIKKLAESLNIKIEKVMAFGDGLNDIEMLKGCGVGIALKNALPEVKKVAKDITSYDNNNEGIRKYLTEKGI